MDAANLDLLDRLQRLSPDGFVVLCGNVAGATGIAGLNYELVSWLGRNLNGERMRRELDGPFASDPKCVACFEPFDAFSYPDAKLGEMLSTSWAFITASDCPTTFDFLCGLHGLIVAQCAARMHTPDYTFN